MAKKHPIQQDPRPITGTQTPVGTLRISNAEWPSSEAGQGRYDRPVSTSSDAGGQSIGNYIPRNDGKVIRRGIR